MTNFDLSKDIRIQNLVNLLDTFGSIQTVNTIRLMNIYEDDKIRVEGMWPLNWQQLDPEAEFVYQAIWVGINIAQSVAQPQVFSLGRSDRAKVFTPVFYFTYKVPFMFHRPGKWEQYVENIISLFEAHKQKVQELNYLPIDDSNLFPDV
jgi:hypothetical protein